MQKVVVFDTGSSFGYFRKSSTTTYSLTHAVIPRSAIEGLIGAILGLSMNEYPLKLQLSKIAVQIVSPVRKLNMQYMHINPKWWPNLSQYLQNEKIGHTVASKQPLSVPASAEFLVKPKYRIYIDIDQQTNSQLSWFLKNRQTHYTPYLGTSSMICFVKYVGEFGCKNISLNDYVPVCSVVPFSNKIPTIKLEKGSRFAIEDGLPIHLDSQRRSVGTYKVVYAPETEQLQIIDKDVIEIQCGARVSYVKFLPTQITS